MRLPSRQGGFMFADRKEAGRELAEALRHLASELPIVLGLARGGVVLAAEVARELGAPLDVLVCLKVGAPGQPEFAIGAVAPEGIRVSDDDVLRQLRISLEAFDEMADSRSVEVERRLKAFRGDRPKPNLLGRTAILVDDGLATGTTAVAAVAYARNLGAAKVVLAAPVCSANGAELLRKHADGVVCLTEPANFYAVGQWYERFDQVEDDEVTDLLVGGPMERR